MTETGVAIHPTAFVHPQADIASDVEVGPFCVIEEHVRIASGCRLFQNVYLTGWTEIGEGCVLHPGVVVGHEPQDVKYKGERSYCRVGKRTILREFVTVHRGTIPDSATVIGDDCFLLAHSHVGHNCLVGNRVTLINAVLLAGHVTVGDRATLGGAAAVHQFCRIGDGAMVAGAARVAQDILPFALVEPDGRIAGLNRVGLRRSGVAADAVAEIREIFGFFFLPNLSREEKLNRARQVATSEAAGLLVRFIEAESKRGYAGRSRRRGNQTA